MSGLTIDLLGRLLGRYVAENPACAKERIYLLERPDLDQGTQAPRAGSFSWSRGSGPGSFDQVVPPPPPDPNKFFSLDELLAMGKRSRPPEPSEHHVLTLDLEEIPELASRFPGARALSLVAPPFEDGDTWPLARLLPVPASTTAPTSGHALTVVPVDVPSAIFGKGENDEAENDEADEDKPAEDPLLEEIRSIVFNRPGYVLGRPLLIQEAREFGTGAFVMQLASRIGGLPLGDCGALYVFEAKTFMQCG